MKNFEIKVARMRHGYSQKDMGEKLGIAASTYGGKERGTLSFSDDEKVSLAEIFGFSLEETNDLLFDGRLPPGVICRAEQ